jgi:hypothetical protein
MSTTQAQERADITAVHLLRQALAALEYYREQWRTTDPVIDAIRRGLEQVQGSAGPVGLPAGEQTAPVPARPAPAAENEDAALLDWLERNLFERKWEGTLGKRCFWYMRGDYRHTMQRFEGETLRNAIRAARKDGK